MTEGRAIVPGEIEGFLSGCPFCTSYRIGIPEVGTRFRIISGLHTGATGAVVDWPKNVPSIDSEFLTQLDCDPPEVQTRVSRKWQMIQTIPPSPAPGWSLPFCLKDASELDRAVVKFCAKSFRHGKWRIDWNSFWGLRGLRDVHK